MVAISIAHTAGRRPKPAAQAPAGDADFESLRGSVSAFRRLRRDETLFHSGAEFESLYAVRSGFLRSGILLEDGRTQVTGFHMPGEILGMDGIGTGRHAARVVALEDAMVCVIPYARIEAPSLQRTLQKIMSRAMVHDQGQLLLLGTMRADQRLAAFLLDLSERLQARGSSPDDLHLRMTREDIGSYIGLSLETVSRVFSRLQVTGLVSVQQKRVRILDRPGLRAVIFPPGA